MALRKAVSVSATVPVEDGKHLKYEDFLQRYLLQNKPVVLTGLMEDWRALKEWVDERGKPDLQFLSRHFGSSNVQVADCGEKMFTDQKRLDMTVSEFVTYWIDLRDRGKAESRLLYLKDWHFVKEYLDYRAYTTPKLFADDWLNQYLDSAPLHISNDTIGQPGCCSDYRFVYMGPAGTWTPLHADVLRSYSWSGNVCGKKLWHLLPPEQTPYLYDRHKRETVYDIYGTWSKTEFPDLSKTYWMECVQGPGDIIFVPSGWYHQVTNIEEVISINNNWFNACNLHWVWRLLQDDYRDTVMSIEDIRSISDDFELLCQRNLAANSGMNFEDFLVFLRRMLERIVDRDDAQLEFDLLCMKNVLESMRGTEYFLHNSVTSGPSKIIDEIESIIGGASLSIELPLPPHNCHA